MKRTIAKCIVLTVAMTACGAFAYLLGLKAGICRALVGLVSFATLAAIVWAIDVLLDGEDDYD